MSAARRTWPQRLLISFNIICVIGALTAAGTLAYFNDKLGDITRIELGGGTLREADQRPPGAPINYLLVGADDATGATGPETNGRGDITGIRTDTIMVLRLDPKDKTARLLSFPRDLWVPIAGTDTNRRINEAFQGNDGAQRLIETIKLNFNIPIDHYVQVNFASFKKLVDSIDGVPIYFDEPVRAKSSGLDVPVAGCQVLDGQSALAFSRARKDYQVLRDGEWQNDPSGDLGRINRQQYFLRVALKRAIAKGIRNPATLRALVNIGIDSVGIDEQLRPSDVMDLGQRFRNFSPDNLKTYTVPVDDAVKGGAQVLEMRADEAEPILAIFRGQPADQGGGDTPADALQPGVVRVQVVNGSRIDGQARELTDALTRIGFIPVSPGNTDTISNTTIRYAPGRSGQARLVARYLAGPVVFEESDQVVGFDVMLVTGSDFQGSLTEPKADAQVPQMSTTTTTTTTAPDTTTTTTTLVGYLPGQSPAAASC
jgi:polyisoprenyl-teichoic acid--peptidoglycan teichoic acid transferase